MATTRPPIVVEFDQFGEYDSFWQTTLRIAKKQAPFAVSRAINRTLHETRSFLIERLPDYFTIRRKHLEKGFWREPARKRDRPIEGAIGTIREYLPIHVFGGTRTADEGKAVGIPVRARRTPKTAITPSRFPSAIMKKFGPRAFIAGTQRAKDGRLVRKGGTAALYVAARKRKSSAARKRRRKNGRRRKPPARRLRLMYFIRKDAKVEARFPFFDLVETSVGMRWDRVMREEFDKAVANARR